MRNYFKVLPKREQLWVASFGPEEDQPEHRGTWVDLPITAGRVLAHLHLFLDDNVTDVERAWAHAEAQAQGDRGRLSVYRALALPGPWRWLAIVGLPASRVDITAEEVARRQAVARQGRGPLPKGLEMSAKEKEAVWLGQLAAEEAALQAVIDLQWCQAWRDAGRG
jgi:hypothetical protein